MRSAMARKPARKAKPATPPGRPGRAPLRDAYALIKSGEAWLLNCHISAYSHSGYASKEPLRTRKLLLHREEIGKLRGRVEEKGLALVPVRLYFKNGRAKCELALVKGKKVWDRREEIRRRADDREIEQKGLALVPVRLYFKNGRAKCELALVKGKKVWDRREEIRRRADDREIEQELKRYR